MAVQSTTVKGKQDSGGRSWEARQWWAVMGSKKRTGIGKQDHGREHGLVMGSKTMGDGHGKQDSGCAVSS
jgi:hypothetical protein